MFETRIISLFSTSLNLSGSNNRIDEFTRALRVPETKDKHEAYNETLKRLEGGEKRRHGHEALLLSPVYRIAISTAASLILIFLLRLFVVQQISYQTEAQTMSFRLPDQSRVVLSANSTLSYPKYLWNRKLQLQGEAYFEVKKGNKFTVKTDDGSVNVLGTRFLVTEQGDNLIVSCYEGKVSFENKKLTETIPAGNTKEFAPLAVISNSTATDSYPASALFKGSYSGESLQKIVAALEEFFQVTIRIETGVEHLFSGQLETASLESALKIICRSLSLDYNFESDVVINLTEKFNEL